MSYDEEKLVRAYEANGTIIVGLDFDNTIYPLDENEHIVARCQVVRDLVKKVRPKMTLCLWTVADPWSLKYKLTIAEHIYDIKFDEVNDSPVFKDQLFKRKPFFNLLLDDNAGLDGAIDILQKFHELTQ